jgi:hypothetical protein
MADIIKKSGEIGRVEEVSVEYIGGISTIDDLKRYGQVETFLTNHT